MPNLGARAYRHFQIVAAVNQNHTGFVCEKPAWLVLVLEYFDHRSATADLCSVTADVPLPANVASPNIAR
jgi:hypothetical protein